MNKTKIELTTEQRTELEKFVQTGVRSVRLVNRAKAILMLDTSENRKPLTQDAIARSIGISRQAVNDARKAFQAAESVAKFLTRKKRLTPPVAPKMVGELEARIIALACSEVPQGYAKWTLRLLADKVVELKYVDSISYVTVQRLLKKLNLSPI